MELIFFLYGKFEVWLMDLDMIIINVFKAESNPRTINRTIYTSSMQIINAHKLMPFIFTPLWSYFYHSIYYFRYQRYGLREFLQKSFAVRIHKVFHLERSGQGSPGPGSPGGYLNWSFCWIRCSQKLKIQKLIQSFIQSVVTVGRKTT